MSFNINKKPKKLMQQLDQALEEEYKTEHKEKKPDGVDSRQTHMSERDHIEMYDSGYSAPGIKTVKIKCKLCTNEVECSSSSRMALLNICANCFRRNRKQESGGVIEI